MSRRTEWVMHIWGSKREKLELLDVEKFHIDMLKKYQDEQKKFDKILVNIALDDINDIGLFNFLKEEVGKVLVCDDVEFKYCQNNPKLCEYVTFRPYVFDRMGESVDIFYSHFKGRCSFVNIFRESFPKRVCYLSELFWSYCMYHESLNVDEVKKVLDDKAVYCWFYLNGRLCENGMKYVEDMVNVVANNYPAMKKYFSKDMYNNSPGSFCWYNMEYLGKIFSKKKEIINISDEKLFVESSKSGTLTTHFCELFIQLFLDDKYVYSVGDYNDAWKDMNLAYLYIYPSKKICRHLLKEFDEYIINNKII